MQVNASSYWHQQDNLLQAQESETLSRSILWCLQALIPTCVQSYPLLWKGENQFSCSWADLQGLSLQGIQTEGSRDFEPSGFVPLICLSFTVWFSVWKDLTFLNHVFSLHLNRKCLISEEEVEKLKIGGTVIFNIFFILPYASQLLLKSYLKFCVF